MLASGAVEPQTLDSALVNFAFESVLAYWTCRTMAYVEPGFVPAGMVNCMMSGVAPVTGGASVVVGVGHEDTIAPLQLTVPPPPDVDGTVTVALAVPVLEELFGSVAVTV